MSSEAAPPRKRASLRRLLGRWTGVAFLKRALREWCGSGRVAPEGKAPVVAAEAPPDDVARVVAAVLEMSRDDTAGVSAAPVGQSDPAAPLSAPVRPSDDYVFLKTLGTGAFSRVKLAVHRPTLERVAVKLIDGRALRDTPRLQTTALREVALMRRLPRHPNVAAFREAALVDGCLAIAMEYVPGCELFEHVATRGRLSEREAAPLLLQLLRGLVHLHRWGVAHRDLKLENVLVTDDGRVVLIDLGLAHAFAPAGGGGGAFARHQADLLTTRCGSEEYAAPEVILGQAYDGAAADAWSFGVVLYGALCGVLPFNPDAYRPRALCESIVAVRYAPPEARGLSPAACALVRGLLVREPGARLRLEDVLGDAFFAGADESSLSSWEVLP